MKWAGERRNKTKMPSMTCCDKYTAKSRFHESQFIIKFRFKAQNLVTKIEFHIKKSQFSLKSQFKGSKCADGGHSLNQDFTVYTQFKPMVITHNPFLIAIVNPTTKITIVIICWQVTNIHSHYQVFRASIKAYCKFYAEKWCFIHVNA